MNYDQTLEQMRSLRLHGMAQALDNLIAAKKVSTLTGEQLLAVLVQQEHDERHGRKIDRLKKDFSKEKLFFHRDSKVGDKLYLRHVSVALGFPDDAQSFFRRK